jgi:hypothetical protein
MICVIILILLLILILLILILLIIIIYFYELQYTYCNMTFSTLLVILLHNVTHNMLHESFCKCITPNFTGTKGSGRQKDYSTDVNFICSRRHHIYSNTLAGKVETECYNFMCSEIPLSCT